MDLNKFKTSDWLKVGGALAVLIGYFLDWTNVDCPPGYGCENLSGSSFFFRGTIPWILVVAVGVLTVLLAQGVMKAGSVPWSLIFLAATALSTLLVIIYVINPTYNGFDAGRGLGSFLALIGSAAALVGSVNGFKEGGGSISDLKDMNKLKASFNQGGGDTPPPPPPPSGMAPPPPPPAG